MMQRRPDPSHDSLRLPQCLITPACCPPGAEPLAQIGRREGVLVLHGLTGSPWEVRPIAEGLAARGFTVAMPLIAGHATSIHALNATTWGDWLDSAQGALRWLEAHCERVHFVGLSMGCLLTLLLRQRQPRARMGATVLCAPALALPRLERGVVEVCTRLGWPAWIGKEDPRLPDGVRPPCYHAVPLLAVRQLIELMGIVRATHRPREVPTLVLHGIRDRTIPMAPALAVARQILGPTLEVRIIPEGGHLLPRDACGPEVVARTLAFIEAHAAPDMAS